MENRKHNKTGRSTGELRSSRDKSLLAPQGAFFPLEQQLMEAPSFQALSINGYRALFRIILEHLANGRVENGRLQVTYSQFEEFGIARKYIRNAIIELDALGLVKIALPGRARRGDYGGRITQFRLTMTGCVGLEEAAPRTNEWKRFKTVEEAKAAVERAQEADRKRLRRKTRSPDK